MDDVDRTVLAELYTDFTQDRDELADKAGVTRTKLGERIQRLRDQGIINRFEAVPDPGKIGFPVTSYHFISLAQNYNEAVEKGIPYISAFRGSGLAMVVLGEYDLIIRKLCSSDARLNSFMNNLINDPEYPRYDKSETYRVTERIRWRGFDIPGDNRYEVEQAELSEIEKDVLQLLQREGHLRTRPNEIADRIDTSPGAVMDAIDFLEEEVILGYSIDIDFRKIGWNRAFLGLSSLHGEYDHVIKAVRDLNPLHVPYIVSGSGFNWAHLGLELTFESIDQLDELTDNIRINGGARETRTFLSTKTLLNEHPDVP